MPRSAVELDPESGKHVLPIRVPAGFDLDFCARAMALEHGVGASHDLPANKVGKHRVRDAAISLAQSRIRLQREGAVSADVLDRWRRYLVDLGEFPKEALDVAPKG